MVDDDQKAAILKALQLKGSRVKTNQKDKEKAEPKGKTNATNPGTLTTLNESYKALKHANSSAEVSPPREPLLRAVYVDPRYEEIGQAIDVNPHELQAIMTEGIKPENELVLSILKKMVSAVKLSGDVDLGPVRDELRQCEVANKQILDQHKRNIERVEKQNAMRNDTIKEKTGDFAQAWGAILIDLVQKVQRNDDITALGDWDRFMCKALAGMGVTNPCATITKNKISIDFKACKALDPDDVMSLPEMAARLQEQEKQDQFHEWLHKAPIKYLLDAMNNTRSDHEREQIAHTIAARKGMVAARNRYGEYEYVRTSYTDYDDDEDDYSRYAEHVLQELIRRKKYGF